VYRGSFGKGDSDALCLFFSGDELSSQRGEFMTIVVYVNQEQSNDQSYSSFATSNCSLPGITQNFGEIIIIDNEPHERVVEKPAVAWWGLDIGHHEVVGETVSAFFKSRIFLRCKVGLEQ
jgi:hypothetical protein